MEEQDNPMQMYFDKRKEDRGWYFVEYSPPRPKSRFAHLVLVVYDNNHTDLSEISEAAEQESREWISRYDVPVFTCAVDHKEENIIFTEILPSNFLIAFRNPNSEIVECHWEQLKDNQIPGMALNQEYLKRIYSDISFRTKDDISKTQMQKTKRMKLGLAIIFAWIVIVPALIAILGWANPIVSTLALAYSLYRAWDKGMELSGKKKKSKKEIEEDEKKRKMEHFYHHCIRNPEGFKQLKLKNFEKKAAEQIQDEVIQLKLNEQS